MYYINYNLRIRKQSCVVSKKSNAYKYKLNLLSQGTYEHLSEPLFGKPYVNNRCRDFADQREDLEKSESPINNPLRSENFLSVERLTS